MGSGGNAKIHLAHFSIRPSEFARVLVINGNCFHILTLRRCAGGSENLMDSPSVRGSVRMCGIHLFGSLRVSRFTTKSTHY